MPENTEPKKLSRWPEVVLICIVVLLIFVSVSVKKRYTIGLVNVERVAEACGASKVIADNFRQWDARANARLQDRQQQFKTESLGLAEELKKETSEAGQARIRVNLVQLRKRYERDVFSIQTDRRRFRIAELRAFRLALRPLTAKVARKHGIEIVFADGEHVLACAQGVDLTQEIAELAKEKPFHPEEAVSPPTITPAVPVRAEPTEAADSEPAVPAAPPRE